MLKPLSLEINAQESEIEAAQVTFFPPHFNDSPVLSTNTLTNLFSFSKWELGAVDALGGIHKATICTESWTLEVYDRHLLC